MVVMMESIIRTIACVDNRKCTRIPFHKTCCNQAPFLKDLPSGVPLTLTLMPTPTPTITVILALALTLTITVTLTLTPNRSAAVTSEQALLLLFCCGR